MSRPKILVVDDNADNRALAKAALEDDYEILVARNGAEALAVFESARPDCVLLDIRMPGGLDGFQTCERIRTLPGGEATPILFVTALRDVENLDRALALGASDLLTKPIRPAELVVRVQAQLKLRDLDSKLREHVELVRRQRDDLLRLQLHHERLMAFVVHDLKNPVTAIDLQAQVLLRDEALPPHARASVACIRSDASHLARLILNLLDIAKAEEGQLTPRLQAVDVPALVDEVFAGMMARARDASVQLVADVGGLKAVQADPDLLRRVLENLVDNALRHSPSNSAVAIRGRADGAWVDIEVVDAGPGIPSELRDSIFDKYVQAHRDDTILSRAGRGLGLAFCRLAVEAHGGRISVDAARPGPGTSFCMRLPRGG